MLSNVNDSSDGYSYFNFVTNRDDNSENFGTLSDSYVHPFHGSLVMTDSSSAPLTLSQSSHSSWTCHQLQPIPSPSHDSRDSLPSCSATSPEIQRATVKLVEVMTARARASNASNVSFSIMEVIGQLGIDRRRFYVISNALSSVGRLSHTSQRNLIWRASDDVLYSSISQLYQEALKYVNLARLREALSSEAVVYLNSAEVINTPGENRGFVCFEDPSKPRWIVNNQRKAQTAATQRLLMLCLMAPDNAPVAFDMDRQAYDNCRVLTALGLLDKVIPKDGSGRRNAYRYAGPSITSLIVKYPRQPIQEIHMKVSKSLLNAPSKSSKPQSSPLIKTTPVPYSLQFTVIEPRDINLPSGEVITQEKVAYILSQLNIPSPASSVVVKVSPSPGAHEEVFIKKQLQTWLMSCQKPNLPHPSPPPLLSCFNNSNGPKKDTQGQRKRKMSSESGSSVGASNSNSWRQLRLDECPSLIPHVSMASSTTADALGPPLITFYSQPSSSVTSALQVGSSPSAPSSKFEEDWTLNQDDLLCSNLIDKEFTVDDIEFFLNSDKDISISDFGVEQFPSPPLAQPPRLASRTGLRPLDTNVELLGRPLVTMATNSTGVCRYGNNANFYQQPPLKHETSRSWPTQHYLQNNS